MNAAAPAFLRALIRSWLGYKGYRIKKAGQKVRPLKNAQKCVRKEKRKFFEKPNRLVRDTGFEPVTPAV